MWQLLKQVDILYCMQKYIGLINIVTMDQSRESIDALSIKYEYKIEESSPPSRSQPPSHSKKQSKKVIFDPRQLIKPFDRGLPLLIQKPEKKKRKATNIPKFIIKVFYRDLPIFPTDHHNERLNVFAVSLNESKTRFHMIELFGINEEDAEINRQNEINRQVLRRVLHRNYDNVLANTHIQHKRLYLMFSKKVLLRLNQPTLIGNIEI